MEKIKKWWWLIVIPILGLGVWLVLGARKAISAAKTNWSKLLDTPLVVRNDTKGSGAYLATRNDLKNKVRLHEGVDYQVTGGQKIYAPFDSTVVRFPFPYAGDTKYKGIILKSTDGTEITVYYLIPSVSIGQGIKAGQVIGTAQKISEKYGSAMQDHIHVEIRKNGLLTDPNWALK